MKYRVVLMATMFSSCVLFLSAQQVIDVSKPVKFETVSSMLIERDGTTTDVGKYLTMGILSIFPSGNAYSVQLIGKKDEAFLLSGTASNVGQGYVHYYWLKMRSYDDVRLLVHAIDGVIWCVYELDAYSVDNKLGSGEKVRFVAKLTQ